jgi:MFS family permease
MSAAIFATYYTFDAMDPVAPLLERQRGFSQAQIGLLDTGYNLAAIVVLLVGGLIIDRAGTRRTVLLFGAISSTGGAIIAAATGISGMIAGRVVLGLGAEPLAVAVTTALASWFRAGELSLAMAMSTTLGRLGSVAADTSRSWARGLFASWRPPLVLAAGVGGLATLSGALYAWLEARASRRYALAVAPATDRLSLRDLVRFERSYFWIVGLCVAFYSTVFPFRRFANLFLADVRGASAEQAAFLNGLLPLTALVATPLFGLLADRVGRRSLLMLLGSGLLLPSFALLVHTRVPVPVPMAMIGVAFSLIPAVMWPQVALIVESSRLGTAYALMTLCQQVGWALASFAVGRLNDASHAGAAHPAGYAPGMWLFTALAAAGVLFAALLRRTERARASR